MAEITWYGRGKQAEWADPQSHVVDKNQGDALKVSKPSPRPDHAARGFREEKRKPLNFWL